MRKSKAEKPRDDQAPKSYSFRATLEQPLGYRSLKPESGLTIEGMVLAALNEVRAERDDVIEITIRRAPRKEA